MPTEPVARVLTDDDRAPIPWAEARARLVDARYAWVSTVHPDGGPQARPVLTVWLGDRCYSSTNRRTRKGRNLTADPRCALSVSTDGMDLTVEGTIRWVEDDLRLAAVAGAFQHKYGWPARVDVGALDAPYGAPTAGPPPYAVYELVPSVAFAFGTDDEYGPRSTRYRF